MISTKKSIVLCGFSGSGKTAVGKILAEGQRAVLMDTDSIIESESKMTVAEIFAGRGEAAFREMERRVIRRMEFDPRKIIALGGGALLDQETVDFVKMRGILVYLKVTPETAVRRLGNSHRRPLLQPSETNQGFSEEELAAQIRIMMTAREAYYRQAHLTVNTEGKIANEVAAEIVKVIGNVEK